MTILADETSNQIYAKAFLKQGPYLRHTIWYRFNFFDFLSAQGGLIISILGIIATFMTYYQEFIQQSLMVQFLYAHSILDRDGTNGISNNQTDASNLLKTHIQSGQEFTANWCSYLIQYALRSLCCCCLCCCRKSDFCRRRMDKYQKFELAMQRLAKERDIIHVLQHNRVADFLLKAKFLAR